MQHLAIMNKSWGLLPKIVSGQKTIELRWYAHRVAPWDRIKTGELVYFKNSSEPVTVRATVSKVLQFADMTPARVKILLEEYGQADGIIESDFSTYYERFKNKHYCILIFLRDVRPVEPFKIDKTGFGAMSAWITTPSIEALRLV